VGRVLQRQLKVPVEIPRRSLRCGLEAKRSFVLLPKKNAKHHPVQEEGLGLVARGIENGQVGVPLQARCSGRTRGDSNEVAVCRLAVQFLDRRVSALCSGNAVQLPGGRVVEGRGSRCRDGDVEALRKRNLPREPRAAAGDCAVEAPAVAVRRRIHARGSSAG